MIRARVVSHPMNMERRSRDVWNLETVALALSRQGNTTLCAIPCLDLSWILNLVVLSNWLMIARQSLDPYHSTSRIRLGLKLWYKFRRRDYWHSLCTTFWTLLVYGLGSWHQEMLATAIAAQVNHDFLLMKVLIDFRWALGVQLVGWVLHFGHHELLSQIDLICCFHDTWSEILRKSSIFYKTTLRIIILLSWLPIIGRSTTISSSSRRRLMTQLLWHLTTIELSLCRHNICVHQVLPRTLSRCLMMLRMLLFCG